MNKIKNTYKWKLNKNYIYFFKNCEFYGKKLEMSKYHIIIKNERKLQFNVNTKIFKFFF